MSYTENPSSSSTIQLLTQLTDQSVEEVWRRTSPQSFGSVKPGIIDLRDIRKMGATTLSCDTSSRNLQDLLSQTPLASSFDMLTQHDSGWGTIEGGHTVLTLHERDTKSRYMIDICYKQFVKSEDRDKTPSYLILEITTPAKLIQDLFAHKMRIEAVEMYLDIFFPDLPQLAEIHNATSTMRRKRREGEDYIPDMNRLQNLLDLILAQ